MQGLADINPGDLLKAVPNGGVIVGGIAAIAVGAIIIRSVYKELTAVKPLTPLDLTRYNNMVKLWRERFPDDPFPESWQLQDNKPTSEYSLQASGSKIKDYANLLGRFHSEHHEIRAIILHHIADLYSSISKRTRPGNGIFAIVRNDGVETMFFSELAAWLIQFAANLDPSQEKGVNGYKNILDYCQKIYQTVFDDHSSEQNRNNPATTLKRIIDVLDNYHEKIYGLYCSRRFNTIVTEMEGEVSAMAAQSLDILYLLIDPDVSNPITKITGIAKSYANSKLMVDKYRKPGPEDHKLTVLKGTVVGQWLDKTLEASGVTYSKFGTHKIVEIQNVPLHLMGAHITDGACYIPSELKSGLRNFNDDNRQETEPKYLLQIRNLHRMTLELYHLSHCLVSGAKVNADYGETWTYGHPGGKAALEELLAHIGDVTDKYILKLDEFWSEYYHKHFIPLSEKHGISRTSEANAGLNYIENTIIADQKTIRDKIRGLIAETRAKAQAYQSQTENEIELSKIGFMSMVQSCRFYYKKTNSETYTTLHRELKRIRKLHPSNDAEKQAYHVDKAETSTIPADDALAKALDCIVNRPRTAQSTLQNDYKIVPPIADNRFHSALQRQVYEKIIKNYHGVIHSKTLSGSLFYSASDFASLQYRYKCLFDAYTILYTEDQRALNDVAFGQFQEENRQSISIFDMELSKFVLLIDQQHLLFKADRFSTLSEVIAGTHQAIHVQKNESGSYTILTNPRYQVLNTETGLMTISKIRERITQATIQRQSQTVLAEERQPPGTEPIPQNTPVPALNVTSEPDPEPNNANNPSLSSQFGRLFNACSCFDAPSAVSSPPTTGMNNL
jgi:hypothetical protein